MEKKYILTDETINVGDHIFHRIQAMRDFGDVKAGDLGGWIEKEENLSHEGACWVYDNAMAGGHSNIRNDARIYGDVRIREYSCVYDQAAIWGKAMICDSARISGKALIADQVIIAGNAKILGRTVIEGKARIYDGSISNSNQYIVIGPIGSRGDFSTFFLSDGTIMVACGCFKGNITEFEAAVHRTHSKTDHEDDYISAIRFVRSYFKNKRCE